MPHDRAEAVRGVYYHGRTLREQAEVEGVSLEAIRQRSRAGLRALRRNQGLRAYHESIISRAYRGSLSSFRHTFTSSTEYAALRLAEIGEWIRNKGGRLA